MQKPLQEVAGQLGVFPEALGSPPLVPEAIDEEATLPLEEVMLAHGAPAMVERVTVEEHFLRTEYVEMHRPAHRVARGKLFDVPSFRGTPQG
jgi:hypothetical protein